MPKTTINDLLVALETVRALQTAVARQGEAIAIVLSRLDALEQAARARPKALE